ncbi:hypothetical protein ACIRQP_32060 [Streptomyces sp. NPDC102274]|uniref:hypothetical protein n=1 Tax=Streptomyces sp. NPDC102274 TaxID=3366151 RepID=UPI0037FB1F65
MTWFSGSRRITAWQGFLLGLVSVVPGIAAGLWFSSWAPHVDDVGLQFAGSGAAAQKVLGGYAADFQTALHADYAVIAGYSATLLLVLLLGRYVFAGRRGRRIGWWAMAMTLLGAACDVTENVLLSYGLRRGAVGSDRLFALATGFSTVKWPLLAAAAVIASAVYTTTMARAGRAVPGELGRRLAPRVPQVLRRLLARLTSGGTPPAPRCPDHPGVQGVAPPWPVLRADGARWPTYTTGRSSGDSHRKDSPLPSTQWRNEGTRAPGRNNAALGFCVSGGGIRSACVTLGALQALRAPLLKAGYLVSVSGGGYTVGAMKLALAGRGTTPPGASPDNVFEPGSPEEAHLRRHSKYIADGTGEWLVALGVLLRGLLASLFLLTAATATLGLALSWAYHAVPVTDLACLTERRTRYAVHCPHPGSPLFHGPAVRAVLAVLGAAAVTWLLWLLTYASCRSDAPARTLAKAFQALVLLTVGLAAVVLLIPLVAWGAVFVQARLRVSRPDAAVSAGITVLLTYIAALVSTLWRRRKTVQRGLSKLLALAQGRAELTRAVPNGFTQYLVVWTVLILLGAAFLLILGWTTATGRSWPHFQQIAIPSALVVIGTCLDQTWMSLHPFYRRRLASAFAVRRFTDVDGAQMAKPYDFNTETTTLSTYGAPQDTATGERFPHVIFAAAGNLSGSDRTPPGRRVVSFTLSHDYVGGPDVGYVCTRCLEHRTKRHIVRDLTVQSAMAVSGAAFASAMGAQARTFQTLLALSNARLGTWLPNPAAMGELWQNQGRWELPRFPAIRRLPYLLREVFGRYPMEDRLLLTTDGGHYENLGLVELLRQGVRTAVCIDASGDTPPFATTLAQAITLAHEELGIIITLHEPAALIPGSGTPLEPASILSTLNTRLSKSAVITGDIIYPEPLEIDGELHDNTGQLIVARATLTNDLPYQLLAYASANPVFPRDSTSDQWFDHRQFDAYQALGHHIGTHVRELLE